MLLAFPVAALAQPEPQPKAVAPLQPIAFSHKTHLSAALKCQQCHPNPDPGDHMTLPAVSRCMACHSTIAKEKPEIKKLAEFARLQEADPVGARIQRAGDGVLESPRTFERRRASAKLVTDR